MAFPSRPIPPFMRNSKESLVPTAWTSASKLLPESMNGNAGGESVPFFTLNGVGMGANKNDRPKLGYAGSFKARPQSAIVVRRTSSYGR
jgi:hypothetical protein